MHADSLLIRIASGTASAEEAAAGHAHLASCTDCAALLASLTEASREEDPVVMNTGHEAIVWERLRPFVEGSERFSNFAPRVAAQLDLSHDDALALLRSIDSLEWMDGPAEGVQVAPVPAGPLKANLITTAVRISPGATLPHHEHVGAEHILVLQGGYDTEYGEFWRGDEECSRAGSSHDMTALEGPMCICIVTLGLE